MNYIESNAWPFIEAKRILEKINNQTPTKGYVLFETGYGPSGLPHIGTFCEVQRTIYVMQAFKLLAPNIATKLLVVSDDYDGMRKIPDNIPDKETMKQYIGQSLSKIPDPFKTHNSYADNMNARLMAFLDSFDFKYEFLSATKAYKNGSYNETLKKIASNIDNVSKIVTDTLGDDRKATYNPFMPVEQDTGIVLQEGVESINLNDDTIRFIGSNGEGKTQSFLNGGVKLQWKCDFAGRWSALDVDYEMCGKDVATNFAVYEDVCKAIGSEPPITMRYELFLDEEGKKISKSKGNGLTINEWLRYAPRESLSYYMYLKPSAAKRLHWDVIPKAVDEYLMSLEKFQSQDDKTKLENPVFHIHNGNPEPKNYGNISYAMLLNLAVVSNAHNREMLMKFILRYDNKINQNDKLLLNMADGAVNYYNDFIKPNKKYRTPTEEEKIALTALQSFLQNNPNASDTQIQDEAYRIGKTMNYELKNWFQCLYQCLLGMETGPRFGSFAAIYGTQETNTLIENSFNRTITLAT